MPLPETRSELLERLRAAYQKLDAEFEDISDYDAQLKHLDDDTSPCDSIAYQLGWGECLLRWDAMERSGSPPDMPATGYGWNDLGALADSFYDDWRGTPLPEMREELAALVDRVATWIDSLQDADLFEVGRRAWAGDKWPIVKWVQVNTIAPYGSARSKLRRWKRTRDE